MQPFSTLFTEKSLLRTNTDTVTVISTEIITDTDNTVTVYSDENTKGKRPTPAMVDHIADRLVTRFNNPARRLYYCKIAWKLPEGVLWNLAEQADKGKDPQRLFTYLCESALGS
jgi:hypothetical protein